MHDFRDDFEMDEHGKLRKKKRVAGDGERITFATVSDQAYGFSPTFAGGSPDPTNPHTPGFRFADTNDAAKIAADEAYEQRRKRMENGWRIKGDVKAEGNRDTTPPPRTLDAAQLRTAADKAWEERNERMRNSWRTSKEV